MQRTWAGFLLSGKQRCGRLYPWCNRWDEDQADGVAEGHLDRREETNMRGSSITPGYRLWSNRAAAVVVGATTRQAC